MQRTLRHHRRSPTTGKDALVALYEQEVDAVHRFVITRVGDPELAADLTSQVFIAAAEALAADPSSKLGQGWLITVARRRVIDHWRRSSSRQRAVDRMRRERERPFDELDAIAVESLLAELPRTYRAVLTMKYLDGFSVAEIADELGHGTEAVASQLARARRALRSAWEARNE